MNEITRWVIVTGLILVSGWGSTVQGQGETSLKRNCYENGTICFFAIADRGQGLRSWPKANEFCLGQNATLPLVTSIHVQQRLMEFLIDFGFTIDNVWIGGRAVSTDGFRWLDGRQFNGDVADGIREDESQVVGIERSENGSARLAAATSLGQSAEGYICQYKDTSVCANGVENEWNSPKDGCLVRYDVSLSWYLARNRCLYSHGDLAVFTDTASLNDAVTQLLTHPANDARSRIFWVGMKQHSLQWIPGNTEFEITYFDRSASFEVPSSAGDNCVAVSYDRMFVWLSRNCSTYFQTVCQGKSNATMEPATPTVTLPVWAVGLISGLACLVYILSIVFVGVIASKCCRKNSPKQPDPETEPRDRRGRNHYVPDKNAAVVSSRSPSTLHPPSSPPPLPSFPTKAEEEDVEYVEPFDGRYVDGEFDDDYDYTTLPEDVAPVASRAPVTRRAPAQTTYSNQEELNRTKGRRLF